MKGLILTAGKGTRLRPLSYTKPKPLLPVFNQPVINYGIERLVQMGIKEIGLVIQTDQEELFREYLQSYAQKGIRLHYIYQQEQKGIAHAVAQAEAFLGSDSFVLLLGDNLIDESFDGLKKSFEQESIQGTVMVTEVSQPEDYGIAEIKNKKIIKVEEKPEKPKSNLAIIGAYMFTHDIFKAIHAISPSARGEYEITDAIQWMVDHGYPINYVKTDKPTFDVGTCERWLKANQWMLKKHAHHPDLQKTKAKRTVIIPPVQLGENCLIEDAVIGPYVSIAPNTTIKKCILKNSIILKDTHLENIPYEITDSIFGEKNEIIGEHLSHPIIRGVFGDDTKFTFSMNPMNGSDSE